MPDPNGVSRGVTSRTRRRPSGVRRGGPARRTSRDARVVVTLADVGRCRVCAANFPFARWSTKARAVTFARSGGRRSSTSPTDAARARPARRAAADHPRRSWPTRADAYPTRWRTRRRTDAPRPCARSCRAGCRGCRSSSRIASTAPPPAVAALRLHRTPVEIVVPDLRGVVEHRPTTARRTLRVRVPLAACPRPARSASSRSPRACLPCTARASRSTGPERRRHTGRAGATSFECHGGSSRRPTDDPYQRRDAPARRRREHGRVGSFAMRARSRAHAVRGRGRSRSLSVWHEPTDPRLRRNSRCSVSCFSLLLVMLLVGALPRRRTAAAGATSRPARSATIWSW